MDHIKLFESWLLENSKFKFKFTLIKEFPPNGRFLINLDDDWVHEYEYPALITQLKSEGYEMYENTIGHRKRKKISSENEMNLKAAIKAARPWTPNSQHIVLVWWVQPEHDYHGTLVPEMKMYRFERDDRPFSVPAAVDYKGPFIDVDFDKYFKYPPELRGKSMSRKFGL